MRTSSTEPASQPRPNASPGPEAVVSPAFVKGHGTENDFVVLPDPHGELDLTGERVRALCDRRAGIGGDGVLRIVRNSALTRNSVASADRGPLGSGVGESQGPHNPQSPQSTDNDLWFMDYRNADGSIAEMCGNGVRVFAACLVEWGWVQESEFAIATRAGVRQVRILPESRPGAYQVTVDMGLPRVFGESEVRLGGLTFSGIAVDMGNPHLACVTTSDRTDLQNLDDLDMTRPPVYDSSLFPEGVNVEIIRAIGPDAVRIRVHERGVGETRSCGTGTVAAAVAALRSREERGRHEHSPERPTGRCAVHVPGGVIDVEITSDSSTLTGPAVLVASGRVESGWWQRMGEG